MKPGFTQEELNEVVEAVESRGAAVDKIEGIATSVLGLVGDTSYIDPDELLTFKCVEKILKVQEPYKKANKLFHPEPTIVDVNGTKVGGGHLGIMAGGNENIILCERGIRTFETATRNTLDLSAVPVIKQKSHLPIIIDPSHATGKRDLVEPLAKAAMAVGADGLMIEVHNNPEKALCDGKQSIKPDTFDKIMQTVKKYAEVEGKEIVLGDTIIL